MTGVVMRRPHLRDIPRPVPLPAGYALRRATGAPDVPALAELLAAAFPEIVWDTDHVRRLTEAPDVRAVYVVTWQGHPVATASSRMMPDVFPGSGVLHWVGTHPDHPRRGLASTLIVCVLRDFVARGDRDATLETQIYRRDAIRLYLRFGFTPVYDVGGDDQRDVWAEIFPHLLGARR